MHPSRLSCLPVGLLVAACGSHPVPVAHPVTAAPFAVPSGRPATTTVVSTPSTRATLKLSSTWAHCHELFTVGSGDPTSEVARLAQGCADATKMHRVGEAFTGQQAAADKPQGYRWKARSGHCYRAYGAAVPAIKNLDLLMNDSNGIALGQDGTNDGAPVVMDSGAVCFKQDDDAAIVVSVGDGTGAYAVEVWED